MEPQIIKAPFSENQVKKLNEYQQSGRFHPFTCCSSGNKEKCERRNGSGEGLLIASADGWICPCGSHKQDWCHSFMAE